MTLSRRHFLKTSGAVALGFAGLHTLLGCGEAGVPSVQRLAVDFGPIRPDPNKILDLPDGFSYQVLSRAGERMTDGFFVPAQHDGMAAFPGPNGLTVLVRNHEINPGAEAGTGPFGGDNQLFARIPPGSVYDAGNGAGSPCLGGTTTLVYDTGAQRLESHYLSLIGTVRNCAGGPTPWNSWITCEEHPSSADDPADRDPRCARDHGYTFEVPASATPALALPVPLTAMGRFRHEAVAVDPASGIVYETEDRHDSLIYRFLPDAPGRLAAGGRLQALALVDQPGLDTRNWEGPTVTPGTVFNTYWIDLDDVEAPDDDLRLRGHAQGAARFARGEGMWYGNDAVYFAITNGGPAEKGQIWRYQPGPAEGTPDESAQPGRLELFIESDERALIDRADNLTVAPWGDLIVCEDGSGEQFLLGITPEGNVYPFARNAVSDSEFAGSTFSPDGSTLFVNIQGDGLTLAITGPWQR